MSHSRRLLSVLLLAAVLLSLVIIPAAAAPSDFGAMPPNPRLRDKIQRGELRVPQMDQANTDMQRSEAAVAPAALTGPVRALAVVVDFSDNVQTVEAAFFDSLIYAGPVAGRGSVADYYSEVTYGQVDIVTVNLPSALGWVRAPQTYDYYVANAYCTDGPYPRNCQKLAEDVVDAVNGVVNFANYDNDGNGVMEPIMLIHAGPGAEFTGSAADVWSHSWVLRTARNYDGVTISKYVIMPE
jgi:immune inhibitor A